MADNMELQPNSNRNLYSNLEATENGVDEGLAPRRRDNAGRDREHLEPEEEHLQPRRDVPAVRPLDVNLYATKKTVAQGMMDLALLTANANQLRYVLESGNANSSAYYYISVTLISISIILQILIGIVLIFLGKYHVNRPEHARTMDRLNNWVVLGVFLLTTVNVFIATFGVHPVTTMDPELFVSTAREVLKMKESDKLMLDMLNHPELG